MGFLFELLDFPDGSRMTDLWNNTWADEAKSEEIASGHFIHLGDDQHVDVEADFLSSHLPFHVAGFGGTFPDGKPWMFIMQKAPADIAILLRGQEDPHFMLREALDRAMEFNPDALVAEEMSWHHGDLVNIYEDEGVLASAAENWSVADLLRGLLAQCCGVDLTDIVSGFPDCAFPDTAHACEDDVFSDIFARWVAGLQ
ncbi:hypothetical protein C7T36_12065 [Rhodococcus sp. AD45-ID]|uniref:hypothetical protein n=1 Tax=unclassified Rhodococcus (in: high G+C Gram-positive bacteria) TaxID=192944 RepID=UPI0005D40697|nr:MULTISPECIES: hypothetical protein [unclassified Rhodococcus (in: high G+C Gram-positive bacteria)]KJF24565.1 hypothetical protein SZ00_01487 [Rhodococcus sp. AD45]PSR42838.1 hypothetical protein C7T36_12065 [Rhodococcus sp. AD45-ID]